MPSAGFQCGAVASYYLTAELVNAEPCHSNGASPITSNCGFDEMIGGTPQPRRRIGTRWRWPISCQQSDHAKNYGASFRSI
jgi:hypothetical protein